MLKKRNTMLAAAMSGILWLTVACSPPGAEDAVPVEVGVIPTEPAQVMQADTPTPENVEIVTATPEGETEMSPAAEATSEAADVGPIDAVSMLLGFDFPFPDESSVVLTEDESLVVVNTPYTVEEATGIVEGTLVANEYELVNQVGSADDSIVYTFQRGAQNVTITISQLAEGDGTEMQFAVVESAE